MIIIVIASFVVFYLLFPHHNVYAQEVRSKFLEPVYRNPNVVQCHNELPSDNILIRKYIDSANNTVHIYCKWNDWLAVDEKQYIGFYNNDTVIGLCPYTVGVNYWSVSVDESGVINATHWTSMTPDASNSIAFDLKFNQESNITAYQRDYFLNTSRNTT